MHAAQTNENNSVIKPDGSTATDNYRVVNNVNPNVADNVGKSDVADSQSLTISQKLVRMTYIPLVPLILGLGAFVGAFFYMQSDTLRLLITISSGFVGITGTIILILMKIDISGNKSSVLGSDLS